MQKFPIPSPVGYDAIAAKFGRRAWDKSQQRAAVPRMLNEILQTLRGGAVSRRHATRLALITMVRPRGLEPPRVAPLAPQASASTNSATAACGVNATLNDAWRRCNSKILRGQAQTHNQRVGR